MVATRSSAKGQNSVELSESGKEVKNIASTRRSAKVDNDTNGIKPHDGAVEAPISALDSTGEPVKKTRGRKRKIPIEETVPDVVVPKKVETRGRKKKVVTVDANATVETKRKKTTLVSTAEAANTSNSTVPKTTGVVTKNGRIPITSIISHKIDKKTTVQSESPVSVSEATSSETDEAVGKTKRKYRVNRENIKINKRIMSKDTEDVIRMFKKFDEEVLTNPEAKARLLSLGFETRKRYITTFKHYIRFCCKKNLDNFFVTGELMKEFYEEQFSISNSNKPFIRLRKMDPAFSKLQEINFLVYHLQNKEIPNRQLALDYLIFKESGIVGPPKRRLVAMPNVTADSETSSTATDSNLNAQQHVPTPPNTRNGEHKKKKSLKKEDLAGFLKSMFKETRADIDKIVRARVDEATKLSKSPESLGPIVSLAKEVQQKLDVFNSYLENGPQSGQSQTQPSGLAHSTHPPIIDMNHDIYTIYQILEEWYKIEPSIESRVNNWGTSWIRDEIDHETFIERKSIVEFVNRLSRECNEPNLFVIANDCDRYIRDKSILDEFISEIELDVDDLFKRIVRYRQRRT
ncbi:zonadhesin-like protein [Scheffersomyces xylosifermentans]|uniref:zonadhesin-like protein n=1 Tax=Scheffersomyces xylosifermentans TaxID=1304137 RepID=UPI00315C8272